MSLLQLSTGHVSLQDAPALNCSLATADGICTILPRTGSKPGCLLQEWGELGSEWEKVVGWERGERRSAARGTAFYASFLCNMWVFFASVCSRADKQPQETSDVPV